MFRVINKRTGKEPDLYQIARMCKWAKHLVYCDIEGFAVEEDGTLILLDECGNVAYPPNGMFEIIWDAPVMHGHWIDTGSGQECSMCGEIQHGYDSGRFYCQNCGAKMDEKNDL